MRWVNETFPPRERARWLLMTMRLSASSLAGTARTLVAVGTVSETFMFLTTAADAPRRGDCLPAAIGVAGLAAGAGLVSAGFLGGGGGAGAAFAAGCGAGAGAATCWGAGFDAAPLGDATGCSRSPPPTGLPGR